MSVLLLALAAQTQLPAIFGDHMVLQREAEVALWGSAAPGAEVAARPSWSAEAVRTRADAHGRWRLHLRTPDAGGPHTLQVNEITFQDVWCGEVWLCSGQSNMEWPLSAAADAAAEIAAAAHPRIRVFEMPNRVAYAPQGRSGGQWAVCTPETAVRFTAVGYFFARELQRTLDVPVGLIAADWGGTVIEAWMSVAGLEAFPEYAETLQQIARRSSEPPPPLADRQAAWWRNLAAVDPGTRAHWERADTEGWGAILVPGAWAQDGLEAFDGVVWLRADFELPQAWAGRALALELGPIDDMDSTWVNGVPVGAHEADGQWQTPRRYQVPAALVAEPHLRLAVRVVDTGGGGGLHGASEALRIYPQGAEAEAIPAGGEWYWKRGAALRELGEYPRTDDHPNQPSVLYNGMIAPVAGYGMRGVLWYQGESNRGRAAQYRRLFPALIADWRRCWGGGEFPWYYVQIAPFRYGGDRGEAAELREAQRLTLSVPNTGMAVTMDIGDPNDIHPANKQDVGRRLARWALARTYGVANLAYSGPLFREARAESGQLRLFFEHADGLHARGQALAHFEVAGADGVFHPATAAIDGATMLVGSPQVRQPRAVRYGWAADAAGNLWNAAGLPASSFQGQVQDAGGAR